MRGVEAKQQERGAERKHVHFYLAASSSSFFHCEPRNATRNLVRDKERKVDGTVLYCVCVFLLCKSVSAAARTLDNVPFKFKVKKCRFSHKQGRIYVGKKKQVSCVLWEETPVKVS